MFNNDQKETLFFFKRLKVGELLYVIKHLKLFLSYINNDILDYNFQINIEFLHEGTIQSYTLYDNYSLNKKFVSKSVAKRLCDIFETYNPAGLALETRGMLQLKLLWCVEEDYIVESKRVLIQDFFDSDTKMSFKF